MGCNTSREEVNILRKQLGSLRTRNEQLSSQEIVLAEELNKLIKITQSDTEKNLEALKLLSQLLGKDSEPGDTRVPLDLENIHDYFSSRLAESQSQEVMCRQLASTADHYQSLVASKAKVIQEQLNSLPASLKAGFAERLNRDFSAVALKDTFENMIAVCEIEKEIAMIDEDDFVSELTKAQACINTQGEVIVVQNKKIRKLLIKQMCVALGNVPSEHLRTAFNFWKPSGQSDLPQTPEKQPPVKKERLSIKSLDFVPDKHPISPLNMFRFLEEVFDKKHEQDLKDLTNQKKPMNMVEFLIDYVNKSFGVEKLALNYIGKIVPTLELMHKDQHPYANWFCQVFHLFECEQLPLSLVLYLTRVRVEFHQLIEKFDRASMSRNSKHVGYKSKSKSKQAQNVAENGGFAFLSDVIDLVVSLFARNKQLGVNLLEEIRPEGISESKYVVYIICNKIKKLGTTPESVYYLLDKDGNEKIDRNEMIHGIKSLDLWVPDSSIEKLYQKLDKTGAGSFPKDVFLSKVNMNLINTLNSSGAAAVSKSSLLIKISEMYMGISKHDRQVIRNMFSTENCTLDELTAVVKHLNSDLTHDGIAKLHQEIEENSPELKTEDAVNLIMEYSLGNLSLDVFKLPEFQNVLVNSLNNNEFARLKRSLST